MYIATLRLKGFKSFGRTCEFAFSPGLTALVGPNGSGKSNVLDALRFVLGDSSSVRLRISRLSDLMFQGSPSVPPAKSAEVALDLTDGVRSCRLCREVDGEGSALYLDGRRIRLKELEEAKRDWRLEGDRFAFIGQGEVMEVIQQSPALRRNHLEVLFGIDLYRRRREGAMSKLDAVLEEVMRIEALTVELKRRRDEIAPGVELAKKAKDIEVRLEEARKFLYWRLRRDLELQLERLLKEDEDVQYRLHKRLLWARLWEKALAKLEEEQKKISERSNRLAGELSDLEEAMGSLRRRLEASSFSYRMAREKSCRVEADCREAYDRHRKLLEEKERLADEMEGARCVLGELEGKLSRLREEERLREAEREEKRRRKKELLSEKTDLELEREKAMSRLRTLGRLAAEESRLAGELLHKLKSLELDEELSRESLEIAKKNLEGAIDAHGDAYALCQTLGVKVQGLRKRVAELEAMENELHESSDGGYPPPVRHVISAVRLGRLKANPKPVVEAFSCPERLSVALGAYLGGRQFWLLVEDLEEAQRCIEQLKANNAGRATFFPKERARPRAPKEIERRDGIIGWAKDLVEIEPFWRGPLEELFGDLLIVTDYKVGAALVREGARFPIVTLEGEVFQPSGAVSGGRGREAKAIEVHNALLKVKNELTSSRKALDEERARLKAAEEKEAALAAKKEEAERLFEERQAALSQLEAAKGTFCAELTRLSEAECARKAEMRELGSLVMSASTRLKGISEELAGLQEIEAPSALKELEGAYGLAAERARSCEAIHARVASELTDAERRLRRLEEETARSQRVQEEEKAKLKEIGLEWKRLRERCIALQKLIEASDEMLASINRKVVSARRKAEATEKEKDTLARSLQSIEERKGSAERELERLVDLWEGSFPYSEADAANIAEPAEVLRRSALELEEELRSFGEVDYGVLSEDNSLSQRISYLGLELKDVMDGKRELEELIRLTDRQAGDVFKGALKKIDVRFDELFRLLLGGGEAHLRLEEGVSLWDAGVEVICRPPGKRAQHLSQLSGGERSLSAIAFLLAAMDEADAPLAVLDEVDASLDEVNVRRFADLLCEYAKKIQLIIMTHRRVTMEGADVIYGVTLSEPGLSQVVGVQLEEWV